MSAHRNTTGSWRRATKDRRRAAAAADGERHERADGSIRKYPNRRLYDTVESRYITLADIRRLVVEQGRFRRLDRQERQQDITRSILLQVIAEQEHGGEPLMSRDFLSQVIRIYGGALQNFVGRYLEEIQLFDAREQRDCATLQERRGPTRWKRSTPWRRRTTSAGARCRTTSSGGGGGGGGGGAVDLEHLDAHDVAFLELVADPLDALVGDLRDVHQAVLARQDRDERAEVHEARDLALVDAADFDVGGDQLDARAAPRGRRRRRPRRS